MRHLLLLLPPVFAVGLCLWLFDATGGRAVPRRAAPLPHPHVEGWRPLAVLDRLEPSGVSDVICRFPLTFVRSAPGVGAREGSLRGKGSQLIHRNMQEERVIIETGFANILGFGLLTRPHGGRVFLVVGDDPEGRARLEGYRDDDGDARIAAADRCLVLVDDGPPESSNWISVAQGENELFLYDGRNQHVRRTGPLGVDGLPDRLEAQIYLDSTQTLLLHTLRDVAWDAEAKALVVSGRCDGSCCCAGPLFRVRDVDGDGRADEILYSD